MCIREAQIFVNPQVVQYRQRDKAIRLEADSAATRKWDFSEKTNE